MVFGVEIIPGRGLFKYIFSMSDLVADSVALQNYVNFFCTFLFSEKAWLFKSHLMPGKLTFLTLDDKEYVVSYR